MLSLFSFARCWSILGVFPLFSFVDVNGNIESIRHASTPFFLQEVDSSTVTRLLAWSSHEDLLWGLLDSFRDWLVATF